MEKNIIIVSVNSKELSDFLYKNNANETILVGTRRSYYMITSGDHNYYIWCNFTGDEEKDDEYLYEFRRFTIKNREYELFAFYRPAEMIEYRRKYLYIPDYKEVNISMQHLQRVKHRMLSIFKREMFRENEKPIKALEKPVKYELLQPLPGTFYSVNFVNNNFKDKFVDNICTIC